MLVIALCLVTFLFGSVRQIKLAVRQLLGARKYDVSYRIVSYSSGFIVSRSEVVDVDRCVLLICVLLVCLLYDTTAADATSDVTAHGPTFCYDFFCLRLCRSDPGSFKPKSSPAFRRQRFSTGCANW